MSVESLPALTPAYIVTSADACSFIAHAGIMAAHLPDNDSAIDTAIALAASHQLHLIPDNTHESRAHMARLASKLVNSGHVVRLCKLEGLAADWSLAQRFDAGMSLEEFDQLPFTEMTSNVVSIEKRVRSPKAGSASDTLREQWRDMGLQTGHNGSPHANIDNALRAMRSAQLDFWWDEFLHRAIMRWNSDEREVRDSDYVDLTVWLQRDLGIHNMGLRVVTAAAETYTRSNVRNCAKDWLQSLSWDGTNRLNSLAVDGFGTADDEYHQAALRCFILGMVKRVLEPGCQVDTMPVFEGPEGIRKSTALRIIGGQWFAECHEEITGKDFLQIMPGKMLLEVSELHSFRRAEIERIKGILTNRVDRYRPSYGRTALDFPRQCVLCGTTNRDDYNTSDTGNRRLLPIRCGIIDVDWIAASREQLFAEAVHRIKAGESHWDIPQNEAREAISDRRRIDPWEPIIEKYADARDTVTVSDILEMCIEIEKARVTQNDSERVKSILRNLGRAEIVSKGKDRRSIRVWKRISGAPVQPPLKSADKSGDECPF